MIASAQLHQSPDFLRLLGHELRWKLVTTLTLGDHRVQELVSLLNQPQNLISYHLKQLRDAQVLTERRSTADARDIYYSLNLEKLHSLYSAVGKALHPALTTLEMPETPGGGQELINQRVRILFLCTENSARSQMAEGILRHLGGRNVEAFSAGTAPSNVHPYATRTLADMGIDISQQRAKHVEEFREQTFDYVLTVCDRARETCPVFAEDTECIHWSFPDPAAVVGDEAQYQAFEQTAQQLMSRIRYFLIQIKHKEEKIQ